MVIATVACGDGPARATVGGTTYDVGVARSLVVSPDDLTAYGEVHSYTDPGAYPFAETTAYALDGVDPTMAVVVRWAPGLEDDAGSLGEWALLTRPVLSEIPGICAYFDVASEASPPHCR